MTQATHPTPGKPLDQESVKLLPCPFCGGPGAMQFSEFELHSGHHVVCHGDKNCPLYCSQPYRAHDTEAEAASIWNARAQPSPAASGWPSREAVIELIDSDVAFVANVMDENRIWLAAILADKLLALFPTPTQGDNHDQ